MRMWSRGLGKQNLGINLSDAKLMSLDEALEYMMSEAKGPLLQEIEDTNVICMSGKILPPTGWEFVIALTFKDILTVAWKLASWKVVKSFGLNPVIGFFSRSKRPLLRSDTHQSQM